MKKVKYFIFSLICLFSCSIVFAENEVVIKSITPVYDEESSVVVTEEDNNHQVTFNDKDQSVKYNVVLENTADEDLTVESVNLTTPTEDFLLYKLDGLKSKDVLKANSTKEVVVSLETIKKEGWGRNFNDELIATINFDNPVTNPNTSTKVLIVILILVAFITGTIIVLGRKNKVARYIVLILALGSTTAIINAKETNILTIKTNVSFESQNVMQMKTVDCEWDSSKLTYVCNDYWDHRNKIKNFYIENELSEITNYVYKFDVSENKNGKVIAYLVVNENNSNFYDLHLQADGIIYPNTNATRYFYGMNILETIDNLEGLDTSNVTDMSYMFAGTGGENFTLDLSNFDTSNVTNMSYMFYGTGSAIKNLTLDLSKFDTRNVTNMSHMFHNVGHNSETLILDLSNFDTSNVTDMSYMFMMAGNYTTNFTLELSDFNTSNVTNMEGMFGSTGMHNKTFTLDLGDKFDTSNVTNMNSMFSATGYNSTTFTLDLGDKFDTSKVSDMGSMFSSTGYNSTIFTLDLEDKFDTSNVTNMNSMFRDTGYNSTIFTLDLGDKFDTSKVEKMGYMYSATGYNSAKLNNTITIKNPNVTNYDSMFNEVATKTGSKVTVNYTSETSDLVDKIIATKSSKSNVVKGVQVD